MRRDPRFPLLAGSLTFSFLVPFLTSSLNLALPGLGREFSLGAAGLGWVGTSYLLASGALLLPGGRASDIWGRRRVFVLGMWIHTAASLLCALAPSAPLLLLFRVAQGMGSGLAFATGIAMLVSAYPPGDRGRVLGLSVASVYLGLSLGPVLGGLMVQQLGWRSLFALHVPLGAAVLLLLSRVKEEWAEAREERFDLAGSALFAASLSLLLLGITRLPRAGSALPLAAGVACGALFLWRDASTPSPLLPLRLLRGNPAFTLGNLAALINYGATFAVGFFLSLFLAAAWGLSPGETGLLLASQPAVMAVLSPLAGRLSDRVEPRLLASSGMALSSLGLFLLIPSLAAPRPLAVAGSLALLGLGFALFSSPNTNAVMGAVERRDYGTASASLGTARVLGQMLSLAAATAILASFLGGAAPSPATAPLLLSAVSWGLAGFGALCALGVLPSLARGRMHRRRH